jgi:positive regulator of sigma E activity
MNIIKFIFILLGLFETISNLYHFSKKNIDAIGKSAKRQHQELPLNIPNSHFFYKAIIMFIFGVLFLITGILAFLNSTHSSTIIWTLSICFGLYGFIQALIYRKEIKVWPAMIVYNIPVLIVVFIN